MSKEFDRWYKDHRDEYDYDIHAASHVYIYRKKVLEILEKYNHTNAYPYIKEEIENL